ncbi:hypothetical protein OAB57_03520, partial [Bacteriovoracaceae bacterium]|nr:hypothetical protein [Bacteriovoracaceae bacterium]
MKAKSGPFTGSETSGTAYGVGCGWMYLNRWSINLDLKQYTLDEEVLSSGVETSLNGEAVISFKEVMLSISVPFEL